MINKLSNVLKTPTARNFNNELFNLILGFKLTFFIISYFTCFTSASASLAKPIVFSMKYFGLDLDSI